MCSQIPLLAAVVGPGTDIPVRSDARIDVSKWDKGRIYPGYVARDVRGRDGDLAIPRGAKAELVVRQTGPNDFALDLESVTVNGKRYAVDTTGPQFNMPREDYDQGRGIVGAIAGAIAGANGDRVEPRGGEIHIPPGSTVTFHLQEPLRVVDWNDPGYDQGPNHYHREHDWYR